jgi:hypothetical protein
MEYTDKIDQELDHAEALIKELADSGWTPDDAGVRLLVALNDLIGAVVESAEAEESE